MTYLPKPTTQMKWKEKERRKKGCQLLCWLYVFSKRIVSLPFLQCLGFDAEYIYVHIVAAYGTSRNRPLSANLKVFLCMQTRE